MSAVKELHTITTDFYKYLYQQELDRDQESLMESLTEFLNKRETFMNQIKPPYTDEEKKLGKEIVRMDREIEDSFQEQFTQLKGSMKQIQSQKRNNQKYINPYQNVSTVDGMFFDKRN
ncbi:flagellar protein FliT [Virgibacillus sp. MSP4-1]|uniref:flagellar protein FliT n=1 Tax=Virgibacillus sp. MSP4-1 TaxID=2700081 RepID=UPI0003A9AE3E|nr:flagellar protein FliT [Virgibacillus sp. MSP4-1]QHS23279.1 flagellar protein FliT [Virgibacillus sp. MSP4-1]